MSILMRLFREDLPTLLRRTPTVARTNSPKERANSEDASGRTHAIFPLSAGMKVVLLNWRVGENDPFSFVNATLRQHLRACGRNVEVIEITEEGWADQLASLVPGGIEFVFTWQGLGSSATLSEGGTNLWDYLKVPLICLHGDHPSHMPLNHELESPYCFHLYTNAAFARYSNRHFRSTRSASVIDLPQVFREPRLERRTGDYFVLAKNVNHPEDTEAVWRQGMTKAEFAAYMMAAETLKSRIAQESYVEIHDILDDLIVTNGLDWLNPTADPARYHLYHSQLDNYLRSYKSIAAVTAMRDFPLRVYGRGWDRVARNAPSSHVFAPGRNMADSQDIYYTRFGLVDISPAKVLHDRTRRAMANGSPFLSSANLEDSFANIELFDQLFFSFRPAELQTRCAAVLHDPASHLELAQQFADLYHNTFRVNDFVNYLANFARVAARP